jgi:hypothetical protein
LADAVTREQAFLRKASYLFLAVVGDSQAVRLPIKLWEGSGLAG